MRRLRYLFLLLVTLGFAVGIIASLINNERSAQLTHAGVAELADQLRFLDQDGDLRARPQIELIAIPKLETQG